MVIFTSYIKKQESQIKIDEKNYKLEIYQTEYNNNQLCINLQLSSCTKIAFEIPTRTENAEIGSDRESGYYFIIGYNKSEESSGIMYYFNPTTKELKKWKIDRIANYY